MLELPRSAPSESTTAEADGIFAAAMSSAARFAASNMCEPPEPSRTADSARSIAAPSDVNPWITRT